MFAPNLWLVFSFTINGIFNIDEASYELNFILHPDAPKRYLEVLTPVLQNVTLFGHRVFIEVIKII